MSYEVEIKFRTDAEKHEDLVRQLSELGGKLSSTVDQEDIYLSHPARDFAVTGEALRLRREGTTNRVTYKGPRQGGSTKTREEIEVEFEEGPEAHGEVRKLWERLGFQPIAVLSKRRKSFRLDESGQEPSLVVVLDVAEDLGEFVEVEAIVEHATDLPSAQAAVHRLATSLGLDEVEPRSYLRMSLERKSELDSGSGPEKGSARRTQ